MRTRIVLLSPFSAPQHALTVVYVTPALDHPARAHDPQPLPSALAPFSFRPNPTGPRLNHLHFNLLYSALKAGDLRRTGKHCKESVISCDHQPRTLEWSTRTHSCVAQSYPARPSSGLCTAHRSLTISSECNAACHAFSVSDKGHTHTTRTSTYSTYRNRFSLKTRSRFVAIFHAAVRGHPHSIRTAFQPVVSIRNAHAHTHTQREPKSPLPSNDRRTPSSTDARLATLRPSPLRTPPETPRALFWFWCARAIRSACRLFVPRTLTSIEPLLF